MGISKVLAISSTILLLPSLLLLHLRLPLLLSLPFLYSSLIALLISLLSHPSLNSPHLLAKSPNGHFPIWSKLLFSPFLLFARVYIILKRKKRKGREPPYTEVADGFFVGGWPDTADRLPPGNPAVVDCTCELPRMRGVVAEGAYLCVPTWDTRSPRVEEIENAVRWAGRWRAEKRAVYVHCAFGHGRSVCVMCALLVASGVAQDWKNAENIVKEKRPFIRMNVNHRKTLEEWSKYRHLSKKGEPKDTSK